MSDSKNKNLSTVNILPLKKKYPAISKYIVENPVLPPAPAVNDINIASDKKQFEISDTEALINCTDDHLWSVDRDLRIIAANKAFIKALESFIGLSVKPGDPLLLKDVFHKDVLTFWEDLYNRAFLGESFKEEIHTPAINNWPETWMDTSFNPIYKNGVVVGIACYSKNITEKKLAEEKLKQSEARLIQAQEVAKLGSWETDLSTLKVICTEETYRIFELDPILFQASQQDFLEFVHPDDRDEVRATFANSFNGHSINTIQHRFLSATGTVKTVEQRWRIFRDEEGKPAKAIGTCQDITERKQAEENINNSEEKRKLIMNAALDAIICIDIKGDITFWNPQAEVIFDRTEREALGKSLAQLIIPERYRSRHIEGMALYLKTGKGPALNKLMELSAVKRNGEEFPIELTIMPIKQGTEEFFCAFVRDITERKKADIALQVAYDEKEIILESIGDGFFNVDKNWIVTYWNHVAEKVLNTPKSKIIGYHLWEVFAGSVGSTSYNKYHEALETYQVIEFEDYYERLEKWFVVSAYPSAAGLSVHFKDITERKVADSALQKAYEEKNTVLERIDDGFFAVDENSIVTYWNKRAEILLDAERKDMIGKNLHEVFASTASNAFYDNYQKAIREKTTVHFVEFSTRTNKWFAVSAYASDNGLSVYFKDVTEQRNAEEKLKESELRYRSLNEQATDAICITDASLKFINVNPYGCETFGYTEEEALQLSLPDILFPEDLANNPIKIADLKLGQTIRNERRLKRKDGTAVDMEVSTKLMEDGGMILFGHDITERKKAEKLINESQNRYRQIVETAQEGIWLIDENDYTNFVNKKMCEIVEYSQEELIGKKIYHFMDDESRKNALLQIERRKQGFSEIHDSTFITKSGKHVWVNLSTNPVVDEYGKYKGALAMITDITERKHAELQLKESSERYNLISQATNDMVWDWDLVTGKVYRNKEGWKKIFRTGDKEIENGNIDDWDSKVHPDDQQKVLQVEAEIQKSEKDFFEVECRVLRDDGTYAYIHDRGNIIRNEQGQAVRLIGATQDITARKEAELQVAKSELRFRSLVQNSSDIICIFNESGYFKYSSPAIKKILGFEPEETIEKNAFAFLHPEDVDPLKDYLSQTKPDMYREMPVLRFKNSQGEWRWIESRVTNMCDNPEVAGYVFNCRDITDRKVAEAEIEKLSFIARETGNAVIITNPEGNILWVNEAFTKITEFEFKEVIGRKPGDFLQGDETNLAVVRYMRSKIKNVEPFECDIVNYSRSGRKYWLRIQNQPQFDETGKLKYFFAIETDITKEKEAEEILKASEERYRYLFNNNPASMLIWDINSFQVLEINDTALQFYGYCRKEFLAKTVFDISLHEDYDKIKRFASIARQKTDFTSELSCRHINKAGEEVHVHISSHLIQFKGRSVILAMATDITEKIILENELENERQLKQQEITRAVITAQEKERQELGSELHDNINQILAGSRLYLGLAQKELKLEHPYLTETDTLITSAITEIRSLSHSLIAPSLTESELLAAIDNIIEVTQQTSGIMISLQAFSFDETNMPDKLKLSIFRIIQEQFNNILKHAGAQKVIVRLVQENTKTILSIKDDGVGFDTNKKSDGVGLMNIKTRASLFNGELNIISSPGKGCELRVVFN